jgi:hypothetical protein
MQLALKFSLGPVSEDQMAGPRSRRSIVTAQCDLHLKHAIKASAFIVDQLTRMEPAALSDRGRQAIVAWSKS